VDGDLEAEAGGSMRERFEGSESGRIALALALAALALFASLATACVPEERSFEGTLVTLVSADAALAGAVQQALVDEGIGAGEVAVTVANGTVALRGQVESSATRHVAEATARSVDGVQDVRNEISVRGQPPVGANADVFDLRLFFARR
jgi:osmotically-inducible protein OsmY